LEIRHERDYFLISKEQDGTIKNGMITEISRFDIGFENLPKTLIIAHPQITGNAISHIRE
jgi:hypothetical protein